MKGRLPEVVESEPVFEAHKNYVVAIMPLPGGSTVGVRFTSPTHMMRFFVLMLETAAKVWPNDPIIQDYQSRD